jgi:ATPase subunit of ABC transporter with duplicated ATPase domains
MPRRKKGYKNNNLISTYINNSIVDSNKRKKEAAREAAREKKTKARAQIANEKERKRLEAANAKAQKSRDKERQKQEQETARKNERILKILKNLEINFENNKLYPNREVLTCVSIQCHEAAITAGSAFKTYAQPRLDTIMIKSAQAYIDTKIERANES